MDDTSGRRRRDLTALVPSAFMSLRDNQKEGARMLENRIRVAPNTVAYADGEKNRLVVEFAIPGAPTDTIDLKLLPDSLHLTVCLSTGLSVACET
jgi:HSP20 family molecular chaperone IbpA